MADPVDLAIRNARIVTSEGVVTGDLAVASGRVVSVGIPVTQAAEELDVGGKLVLPGGVDPHAHIEQMSGMGQWNADTFETATRSAAMGGTTCVISFAAQAPGQPLNETVAEYQARAVRGAMIDHAFHITVTDLEAPNVMQDLTDLIRAGHRSVKVFTTYNIQLSDAEILQVLSAAKAAGGLVCVHAETDAIIDHARNALISAGQTKPRDHARSRPRIAEIDAVARICRFAEYLDQPVMLFHISTRETVEVLRRAQARGVPVQAETCPHYLFMTEDVLEQPGLDGAKWMCSPPQRRVADQEALWSALQTRVLALVSSDHAPYRFDESGKLSSGPAAGFHQIANGLPGLETRLPLLFDAIVTKGRGTLQLFAELTATAPARIYGLENKGEIAPGKDADLVVWNPEREHSYGANDLHDNVGYNPWEGHVVKGWPEHVFLRGEALVKDGAFLGTPGQGRWIARPNAPSFPPVTGSVGGKS